MSLRVASSEPPPSTAEASASSSPAGPALLRSPELVDLLAVGVCVTTRTGDILDVNADACEMLGYTRDELLGQTILELTHPDDRCARARLVDGAQPGAVLVQRRRLRRRDGSWLLAEGRGRVLDDGRIVTVIQDLCELQRAEEARSASDREFQAIFELAATGKATADAATGRFTRVNREFCAITGYSEAELLQRTYIDVTHPDDRGPELENFERALRGDATGWTVEKRYLRKDGSVAWVLVTGSLLRDASGTVVKMIASVVDISGRKRMEEERERLLRDLARQRDLLRALIESAPAAIALLDPPDFRCTLANPAFFGLAGTRDGVLGRTLAEWLPDEAARLVPILEEVARTGQPFHEVDAPFETVRDGVRGVEWRQLSYVPIRDEAGRVGQILLMALDTTPQVRARREVEGLAERLAAANGRLEAVLEQMPAGVIIAEAPSGKLVVGNHEVARIWRHAFIPASDVEGYAAYKGFHPDGRPYAPHEWPLSRAIATGEVTTGEEIELLRGDGTRGVASVSAAPIRDSLGAIVAGVVMFEDITERRQLVEALAAREQLLRLAQRAASAGVWGYDGATGRITLSSECARLVGLGEKEAYTVEECVACVDPRNVEGLADQARRRLAEGGDIGFELRVCHPQRGPRWLWILGGAERVAGERRLRGIALDITERKQSQLRLEQSEALFRTLGEAAPDIAWILDADARYEYVNRRMLEYTGMSVEELNGDWTKVSHPDDVAMVEARWQEATRTRGLFEAEWRFRRRDGAYRWFLTRAVPVLDPRGGIARWVGTATDIDDRRRTEQALRESEARYRAVGEAFPFGLWVGDAAGELLHVSENFLAFLGMTLEELKRDGWSRVVSPSTDEMRRRWRECVARGETWDVEREVRGADGSTRIIWQRGVPVRDAAGQVTSWVGINLDITDRKRAYEALQEADRGKDAFLAVLSHELRNPLAPIRNSLFVLDRAEPGGDQARRALAIIDRQTAHLARLVDDLLDVTRVTRGKIRLQRERLDVVEVVRRAADDHRMLFSERGVHFAVGSVPGPVWIDADGTRVAQIVGNLLQNAAKFTARGGRVELLLERASERSVAIRVCDDGVGIAPAMLPRLFQPFMQADETLARTSGGLGLGLSLVKALVELHGGGVTAQSEGLGRGAQFTVTLPSEEVPVSDEGAAPVVALPASSRVLVIEDNVDAAASLRDALEVIGHNVAVAHSGSEGLALAREFRPDVVLCDIGLPEMDGFEVARAFRADEGLRASLLVALTGYAMPEDARRAREAGFDQHLSKPPQLESLEALLVEAARARRKG